jgi:DNA-binding transcriptional ArsR family regulator
VAEDRCELLRIDRPRAEAIRKRLRPAVAERGAARAKALADPTPPLIALALHHDKELCVCDLARITGRAETSLAITFARCVAPVSLVRAASTRSSSTRSLTSPGRCSMRTPSSPS